MFDRLFINENRNLKIKINMQTFSRAPIPIIGLTERPPDKGNRGKNDRWWSSNNKIFFLRWIWPKQINLLRFLILLRGHFLWKFRTGNVSDTMEIYEKFDSVERGILLYLFFSYNCFNNNVPKHYNLAFVFNFCTNII